RRFRCKGGPSPGTPYKGWVDAILIDTGWVSGLPATGNGGGTAVRNDPLVNAPDETAKLVADIRAGSGDAFSQLVRLYQAKVRCYLGRFVRGADAVEDLAQETFISAYRSVGSYRQQASLALWLLGIARNLALKHLREEHRRRSRE